MYTVKPGSRDLALSSPLELVVTDRNPGFTVYMGMQSIYTTQNLQGLLFLQCVTFVYL